MRFGKDEEVWRRETEYWPGDVVLVSDDGHVAMVSRATRAEADATVVTVESASGSKAVLLGDLLDEAGRKSLRGGYGGDSWVLAGNPRLDGKVLALSLATGEEPTIRRIDLDTVTLLDAGPR